MRKERRDSAGTWWKAGLEEVPEAPQNHLLLPSLHTKSEIFHVICSKLSEEVLFSSFPDTFCLYEVLPHVLTMPLLSEPCLKYTQL